MLKLLSQINTDVISPAGVSCFYHNQYTSRTLVMVATLPTHTKKYIFFLAEGTRVDPAPPINAAEFTSESFVIFPARIVVGCRSTNCMGVALHQITLIRPRRSGVAVVSIS